MFQLGTLDCLFPDVDTVKGDMFLWGSVLIEAVCSISHPFCCLYLKLVTHFKDRH